MIQILPSPVLQFSIALRSPLSIFKPMDGHLSRSQRPILRIDFRRARSFSKLRDGVEGGGALKAFLISIDLMAHPVVGARMIRGELLTVKGRGAWRWRWATKGALAGGLGGAARPWPEPLAEGSIRQRSSLLDQPRWQRQLRAHWS